MSKEIELRNCMKQAMLEKSKENTVRTKARSVTFKNIFNEASNRAKEQKLDNLSDELVINAVKKEIKQLTETLSYCKGNEDKENEVNICLEAAKELLPKMASEEDIKVFVEQNKDKASNIGAMMKLLKEEFGASLDGKLASQIVKNLL